MAFCCKGQLRDEKLKAIYAIEPILSLTSQKIELEREINILLLRKEELESIIECLEKSKQFISDFVSIIEARISEIRIRVSDINSNIGKNYIILANLNQEIKEMDEYIVSTINVHRCVAIYGCNAPVDSRIIESILDINEIWKESFNFPSMASIRYDIYKSCIERLKDKLE